VAAPGEGAGRGEPWGLSPGDQQQKESNVVTSSL